MKDYCIRKSGECESCSLASYNRDCQNNVIRQGRPEKAEKTAQINNRIRFELKEKFVEICNQKGYSQQLQLEKMFEAWIEKES